MYQADQAKGLTGVTYWWDSSKGIIREDPAHTVSTKVAEGLAEPIAPIGEEEAKHGDLPDLAGKTEEVEPFIRDQPDSPRRGDRTYLLLAALLLVGFLFFPQGDSVKRKIKHLKQAGDIDGLRALDQETSVQHEIATEKEKKNILDGLPFEGWTFENNEYQLHPYRLWTAQAIAAIDSQVVVIAGVVGVFPGLDMWVVVDENGVYFPITFGSKIVANDMTGFVTLVGQSRLQFQTESGEQQFYERNPLVILGFFEKPGKKTIIYPRDEGSLAGLLAVFAQILGIPEPETVVGQVGGFYPVFTDPAEVYSLLQQVQHKPVPVLVGFHRTRVIIKGTGNEILNRFRKICPFPLEWDANRLSSERICYAGGSFMEVVRFLGLTPIYQQEKCTLMVDQKERR